MDVQRLFPLSGIVFVALAVVTIAIGGSTPSSDAAASKVASFYDEHAVSQGILTFVLAAAVPFLVFFGIAVARLLSLKPTMASADARGAIQQAGSFIGCSIDDDGHIAAARTAKISSCRRRRRC